MRRPRHVIFGLLLIVVALAVAVPRDAVAEAVRMPERSGPRSAAGKYELLNYEPVASSAAVVTSGNARFSVLTPRVVRMEYASSGVFTDAATLAVVNRNLSVPEFTTNDSGSVLTITTDFVEVSYTKGAAFSASTLSVKSVGGGKSSQFADYAFGDANDGNLLGTIKSLDLLNVISLNCTDIEGEMIHDESLHCRWGLVSRLGWALLNDTENWTLTPEAQWVTGKQNGDDHDLYFFGHGMDYKGALADYVAITGVVPMLPRAAGGIWRTRWYNYDSHDVKTVIEDYEIRGLPLDINVLDMDWHTKGPAGDASANVWGAYSWDTRLFPVPEATMDWIHDKGLMTLVNLHDDNGVATFETEYEAMRAYMGLPASTGTIGPLFTNMTYMYGLDDIVFGAVVKAGVDYAWIDWQQGGTQGGCPGEYLTPTALLNKLRGTDFQRQGVPLRDMILARWYGYGNHRYMVGFSGDVAALTWSNLAFQPYFTMTAANVAYSYWSHDIVGPWNDRELHTRWIQWATWSGVFRTHDRGMSAGTCANMVPDECAVVEVYNTPKRYFKCNRAAMVNREELIPYIYTANRAAFETGLTIVRPMYYDFPEFDLAYAADAGGRFGQYMFGDDFMVSPVVTPADPTSQMATLPVWIPPGTWVELHTGAVHTGAADGSTVLTKSYDLEEVPVFVRGGAVIPRVVVTPGDTLGQAMRQYTHLVWELYPGASTGATQVYEDDAYSRDYLDGAYTWTTGAYTRTNTSLTFTVTTTSPGAYPEMPKTRTHELKIVNAMPATAVKVNGQSVPYARFGGPNSWRYHGDTLTLIVHTPAISTAETANIQVTLAPVPQGAQIAGMRGAIQHAQRSKKNLDETRVTPGAHSAAGGVISEAAATGDLLGYLAGTSLADFATTLSGFPALFDSAYNEIADIKPNNGPSPSALTQLWDANRQDNVLCGSSSCLTDNDYYQTLRVEGYQALPTNPYAVPLNDAWSNANTDNLATTAPTVPDGYAPAAFADGWVLGPDTPSNHRPNTAPLQVWYSASRRDYLTVASQAGIAYANQNGYTLVNGCVGYVYTQQFGDRDPVRRAAGGLLDRAAEVQATQVNYTRWSYSMALLNNAWN